MTKLEQLYAAERDLEQRLAVLREQIREEVNYLGINKKRIRTEQLLISCPTGHESGFGTHQPQRAVIILHIPTGISVCKDLWRSQHRNKHEALQELVEKLEAQGWVSDL